MGPVVGAWQEGKAARVREVEVREAKGPVEVARGMEVEGQGEEDLVGKERGVGREGKEEGREGMDEVEVGVGELGLGGEDLAGEARGGARGGEEEDWGARAGETGVGMGGTEAVGAA